MSPNFARQWTRWSVVCSPDHPTTRSGQTSGMSTNSPNSGSSDHSFARSPDHPILLDSHAHLDDSDFDADRTAVVERARAAGLRYILIAGGGGSADRLESPLAMAEGYDWIYAAAAVHPHEARNFTDSHAEKIVRLAQHSKVVA